MRIKKTNKILKATSFAVIFAICCGIITTSLPQEKTYAATVQELEDEIKKREEANKRLEAEIAKIADDKKESKEAQAVYYEKLMNEKELIDSLNNKIAYKEMEIADKQTLIDEKQETIENNEKDIENKQVKINDLDKKNRENAEKFGKIISAMYMNDNADVFSILSGSESFYDMLVDAELMKNIADQNVKFMDELKADIDEQKNEQERLKQDIVDLKEDKSAIETDKSKLEDEKAVLDGQMAESTSLSDQYNYNYQKYASTISNLSQLEKQKEDTMKANEADIRAYEAQVEQLIRNNQTSDDYVEGDWMWPLDKKFGLITTYFGYDPWRGGNHSGIDVGNSGMAGANIYAAKSGTVIVAKTTYTPGYSYGKYVVIDHGGTISTLYAHCSQIYVSVGQQVKQGDVIAAVGTTGWSTGNHLHFEVRKNGVTQNPFNYVNKP